MKNLHAMAYVSRISRDITPAHIHAIVTEASEFNIERGVTGALVFDGTCFFQYLEGSRTALNEIYARIHRATSHTVLMEFVDGPADSRRFEGWSMFYREGAPSGIEDLNWLEGQGPLDPDFHRSVAMKSLSYFWDQFPEKRAA